MYWAGELGVPLDFSVPQPIELLWDKGLAGLVYLNNFLISIMYL